MSAMMMALLASAGGRVVNPLPVGNISDFEINPTNPSATLTLNSDGTLAVLGNASTGGPNWHDPTIGGIGASYWCRLTVNSGSNPNSGTVGSILSLSPNQAWTWSRSTVGTTTAACTIEVFSDAGGAQLAGADTFNVTVDKESGA